MNALIIVEKPKEKLRICLDPKNLNQAIRHQHYKLSTEEEIFSEKHNAKFFRKLDDNCVYWQINVDEESSKLFK